MTHPETYISVDVETAGPNPGTYSLLSIGACLVADPTRAFYVEVQPVNDNALPRALRVSGLTLEYLAEHGLPPAEAMAQFETWVLRETPPEHRPVFVAFNAPFDWMFVCDYFHRYQLIMSVIDVLEGGQEAEIVRLLLRLRDRLSEPGSSPQTDAALEALRAEIINIVNNFFYDKLTALPTIKAYISQVGGQDKPRD